MSRRFEDLVLNDAQRALVKTALRGSEANFHDYGSLLPVCLIAGEGRFAVAELNPASDAAMDDSHRTAARAARAMRASVVVRITEAWAAQISTDEAMQIERGLTVQRASEGPNRREIVNYVVITKLTHYYGQRDIIREPGRPPMLSPVEWSDEFPQVGPAVYELIRALQD